MDALDHLKIVDNPDRKRFETTVNGHTAFVEYIRLKGRIIYTHTEVPRALEGQSVGSALARFVLDFARREELRVQPLCPFIAAYIKNHFEDYGDLLAPGFHVK